MTEKKIVRIQIRLTEEQSRALKSLATQRSVSVADLIRQSIDEFIQASAGLGDQERWQRAIAAAGKYSSGKTDVAVNHDDHLADLIRDGLRNCSVAPAGSTDPAGIWQAQASLPGMRLGLSSPSRTV